MAKARALDKRRKSIRNIRKITRTMELIATARFRQAMDRAVAASAYAERMTAIVADLAQTGLKVSHPLLDPREETKSATMLVLAANRGMCGGYNGNVGRKAITVHAELEKETEAIRLEVSGKRAISALRYRGVEMDETFTHFEDKPLYEEVEVLADRYLKSYLAGELDRLDVVYTKFLTSSRQVATVETLLPLGSLPGADEAPTAKKGQTPGTSMYEFLPSAESILEEVVPTSFKVRLFKCFLDAAVSEQIARMVAMKSATENADDMIRHLSMTYNRARQSQITGEITEIIGGVEALKG